MHGHVHTHTHAHTPRINSNCLEGAQLKQKEQKKTKEQSLPIVRQTY